MTEQLNTKLQELVREISNFAVAISSVAGTDRTGDLLKACQAVDAALGEEPISID
jgi:hypothetical protein